MSREELRGLVAAYVLGALDPDEHETFAKALSADDELRGEVAAYEEVVAGLAEAVPEQAPPQGLRDRILKEARAEVPIQSGRSDSPPGGRAGLAAIAWLAAAAGLAGALGFGVAYRGSQQANLELDADVAALNQENERLVQLLEDRNVLLSTLTGPEVRTAALSATDQLPSARLFWNTGQNRVFITAFDLPPAPAGRIYQLWGIPDGENPVSLGTFQTQADGTATVSRPVPPGSDFAIGAVTDEPAGGSPQPTTTPFLVGEWSGGG